MEPTARSSSVVPMGSKTPSPRRRTPRLGAAAAATMTSDHPSSPLRPSTDPNINISNNTGASSRISSNSIPSSNQNNPFRTYSFPDYHDSTSSSFNAGCTRVPSRPCSPTSGPISLSSTSIAQHRISISGRPRRPSPLLHEIQPPTRRLSSHQMLLLTPFGGPIPSSALANPASFNSPSLQSQTQSGEMARGSSSMGRQRGSMGVPMVGAGGAGDAGGRVARGLGGSMSSSMAAGPSSMGMDRSTPQADPVPPLPARISRHHSIAHQANPSPLSQPLTTIQSGSSCSGGTSSHAPSREPSSDEGGDQGGFSGGESGGGGYLDMLETVPMMRSNSLPVLTLRELEALKEKDGELGIARGSNWAWVSREDDNILDVLGEEELHEPAGRDDTLKANTGFTFNDPFASTVNSAVPIFESSFGRTKDTNPEATSPEYRYSPTAEVRRMSDAPATWSNATSSHNKSVTSPSRTRHSTSAASGAHSIVPYPPPMTSVTGPTPPPFRRAESSSATIKGSPGPSVPVTHIAGDFPPSSSSVSPPSSSTQFFNSRGSLSALTADTPRTIATFLPEVEAESPHGPPLPSATRPRLLRYKTSPARFTGLGLNIVVKASGSIAPSGPPSGTGTSSGPNSAGTGDSSRSSEDKGRLGRGHGTDTSTGESSRKSSQRGIDGATRDEERSRKSSLASSSNLANDRKRTTSGTALGTWAAVDIVDALATASASFARERHSSSASAASSVSTGSGRLPGSSNAGTKLGVGHARGSVSGTPNHTGPSQARSPLSASASLRQSVASIFTIEHVSLRSNDDFGVKPAIKLEGTVVDPSGRLGGNGQRRNTSHTIPRNMAFSSLRGRGRWDSVDSAMINVGPGDGGDYNRTEGGGGAGGFNSMSLGLGGGFLPRRGSLAVLTHTALGPWAMGVGVELSESQGEVVFGHAGGGEGGQRGEGEHETLVDTEAGGGMMGRDDGIGSKDIMDSLGVGVGGGGVTGGWQERRGSWAEGWGKK